jgi:hypothetical protein
LKILQILLLEETMKSMKVNVVLFYKYIYFLFIFYLFSIYFLFIFYLFSIYFLNQGQQEQLNFIFDTFSEVSNKLSELSIILKIVLLSILSV